MGRSIPRSRTLLARSATVLTVVALLRVVPLNAQARQPTLVALPEILPPDLQVAQLVLSRDTARAYVVSPTGEIWFYDRAKKTSARIAKGEAWDLSLAASGTALAFARPGAKRTDRTVWVLPLDPRTGLAAGPERQASAEAADAPSVSPDGRMLAFARDDATGVGQSVVVVPVAGGPAVVVLRSLPSGVGFIRWAPDGKALYLGVNPPVACDPGWSCLPLRTDHDLQKGTIQRVPIGAGTPTIVAVAANAAWPGLSPDGTLLVYPDTGRNRQLVVADANGRRLQTFAPPAGGTIQGWVGGSTLLVSYQRARSRLQRYTVADNAVGVVSESVDGLTDPSLSSDGALIAAVHCVMPQCQLRVLGIDGTLRREVPLPEPYLTGNSWSPDRRWIAYVARASDQALRFNAVEIATGRIARLGELPGAGGSRPTLLWHADSRTITVALDRVISGSDRHTGFHEFDIDGHHRELRDLALGAGQAGAMLLDAGTAFVYRTTARASNQQLPSMVFTRLRLDPAAMEQPFPLPPAYYFPPAFSADRTWAVFRSLLDESGAQSAFEVIRTDGTGRRTLTVPFTPAFGSDNPLVTANGEQLLVRENDLRGHDSGVYLATVATSKLTKLFAIPTTMRAQQFAMSADGRTLVYTTSEPVAPRFSAIDPADLVRSARQ